MKVMVVMLVALMGLQASAQHIANTFQAVEKGNFSMQRLDAIYPPAIAENSVKAVFKENQQNVFITAYTALLNNLAIYLNKNNFKWGAPTRIFNRIYFAADGSINYYLVNLVGSGLNAARQQRFLTLLNSFIKINKINITADTRFAQCSPVIYKDVK